LQGPFGHPGSGGLFQTYEILNTCVCVCVCVCFQAEFRSRMLSYTVTPLMTSWSNSEDRPLAAERRDSLGAALHGYLADKHTFVYPGECLMNYSEKRNINHKECPSLTIKSAPVLPSSGDIPVFSRMQPL